MYDDLGLTLSRIGTVTRLRLGGALTPLDLTLRQFAVLRELDGEQGISQSELGERLNIDASSMVSVLDHCQRSGWTQRRPSPTDRRRHRVLLTPEGRRKLIAARNAVSRAEAELFAPLDETQRTQLHELLWRLGPGEVVSSASAAARDQALEA